MKIKLLIFIFIIFLGGIFAFPASAFNNKDNFPKTANYYLQPLVPKNHYESLAKYDLLILDVDTQTIDAGLFSKIEKINPDIKFLAYIPSQSVNVQDLSSWARFRNMEYSKVNNGDWWLKDSSGGPHVKVFNQVGQIISEFMAYDEKFRGGVNIAVGDVNGDGINEIVTGTGFGGGPHVKVFNQQGKIINEFMAYDEKFRGGVGVVLGDVDNNNYDEIITGPGPTGGPHVKVFNQNNLVLNEFMAYNENDRGGIMVMSDDLDKNGFSEILVGTINF